MKLPNPFFTRKFEHNQISYLEMQFKALVSLISSGQYFTLAYTETDHRLYLIGENKHAHLSNQEIDISSVDLIREISTGWTHAALLDESGAVYTFGRNNYYQLGRELTPGEENIVKKVETITEKVKSVSCGSEHTAVLTDSGKVLTWGWNEHGNCGVNGVDDVEKPTEVKLPGKCLIIESGCGFCFALVEK